MLVSKLLAATMIAGPVAPHDAARPTPPARPSRRPDAERDAAARPAGKGMPRRREDSGRLSVHS
jgi:hypothetical protein